VRGYFWKVGVCEFLEKEGGVSCCVCVCVTAATAPATNTHNARRRRPSQGNGDAVNLLVITLEEREKEGFLSKVAAEIRIRKRGEERTR
jgi:hypothetical protein